MATVVVECWLLAPARDHVVLEVVDGREPFRATWSAQLGEGMDPTELARATTPPGLDVVELHSTSWRYEHGQVVLTFAALRARLGDRRGERVAPYVPSVTDARHQIDPGRVVSHAVRHAAFLVHTDPTFLGEHRQEWEAALDRYLPLPFQELRP